MNRITTTIIATLFLWCAFAQLKAQEQEEVFGPQIQERNHKGFSALEVSQEIIVTLSEGADFRVAVEADEDMLPSIITSVSDGTLKLSINDKYKRLKFQYMTPVKVNVTMPKLKAINASGGSIVTGDTHFTSEDLNITVSTNAEIRLLQGLTANYLNVLANSSGKLIAKDKSNANKALITAGSKGEITLNLDVDNDIECRGSSHGKIIMEGKAPEALLSATSNSELRMKAFQIQRANVVATTSAVIGLTVKEFMAATATYKAIINYWGKPKKISAEATSGARIK